MDFIFCVLFQRRRLEFYRLDSMLGIYYASSSVQKVKFKWVFKAGMFFITKYLRYFISMLCEQKCFFVKKKKEGVVFSFEKNVN